jgi:signal transduction histidine kinase
VAAVAAVAEAVTRGAVTVPSAAAGGPTQFILVFGLVGLAGTLPLAFLRDSPAGAAAAISAASLLALGLFQTLPVAALAAQIIALYVLSRHGAQFLAGILAAPFAVLAVISAAGLAGGREMQVFTVLLTAGGLVSAWAGAARRARSEAALHTAAQQAVAGTLLEHTARGERARISRELHDVVAHYISMIAVQAESARLTVPGMPPAGVQQLSAIGDTARTALTEMRRLVGVLREDTRTGEEPETRREPQPGVAQLTTLVDASRAASGAGTRLIVSGPMGCLDPGVELAAYRIVQEALTNARRHAPGTAVDVELTFGDGDLRVQVRDNGPGPPDWPPAGGHGLLGMRERAAAVGGELHTGPAPGGGFLVDATLPSKQEAGLRTPSRPRSRA